MFLQLYQISDKSFAWSAWEKERAKEAKERQIQSGVEYGNGGTKVSSNLNEPSENIRTTAEVAAKIGSISTSGTQKKIPLVKLPEGFLLRLKEVC